jgi:hypothetical protein
MESHWSGGSVTARAEASTSEECLSFKILDDINIEKRIIRLWTRKTRDGSREGEWLPISEDLSKELMW